MKPRLSPQARVIAVTALVVLLGAMLVARLVPGATIEHRAVALLEQLEAEAERRVKRSLLQRPNGNAYTVDLGQLAMYAARSGNRSLYVELTDLLRDAVVVDAPDDDYTRGFVAWRYADDTPLDASGTTEALRVASALWDGGARFDRPDDTALALTILEGYARHAAIDQDIWFIRNYFNLQTRAFSPNSYLIDYDPDLLARVGRDTDTTGLVDVAEKSAKLFEQAKTPAGLLHGVILPEIATLMPGDPPIFSPNRVEMLANVANAAVHATSSNPVIAHGVLDFATDRIDELQRHYDTHTGRATYPTSDAGIAEFAPLLRLAVALDRPDDTRRLLARLVNAIEDDPPTGNRASLYLLSESLLALEAVVGQSPLRRPRPAPGP
ncbi:MAG: hypothetical protein AAGK09_05585 [Planctomycetota bacterium]